MLTVFRRLVEMAYSVQAPKTVLEELQQLRQRVDCSSMTYRCSRLLDSGLTATVTATRTEIGVRFSTGRAASLV
jgi:hypothetical protein